MMENTQMTLVPWIKGQPLIWDVTIVDYILQTVTF
jgi:hypothetical protein